VLVCAGVLVLPKKTIVPGEKKFNLPYINSRFIVPVLYAIFLFFFYERILSSFHNITHEAHQEILFLVFIVLATAITIASVVRSLSLIPVLGMLCCLYLMIEIPARSWGVFFGWMAFGLVIYFSYGYWKSKLAVKS
jgi:type III secretory pathway component EscU